MLILLLGQFKSSFRHQWSLYLINSLSVVLIIMLFAYINGSKRQLNLSIAAFFGDLIVKMNLEVPELQEKLKRNFQDCNQISKKVRCEVQIRKSEVNNTVFAEFIGVDFNQDAVLKKYLSFKIGGFPRKEYEVVIPASLATQMKMDTGSVITVSGKTSSGMYNAAYFKVSGIYHSSNLILFRSPQILGKFQDVCEYFQPRSNDVEYCLFFKGNKIPKASDSIITAVLDNEQDGKIYSIEEKKAGYFDVMNLSIQFSVFLNIIVTLCNILVLTLIVISNFNVSSITMQQRKPYLGTLMSFGVGNTKIAIIILIEFLMKAVLSVLVGTIIAYIFTNIASAYRIEGGAIEILQVLLTGTNRIDFYIKKQHILTSAVFLISSVLVAQVPLIIKMIRSDPIEMIRKV